MEIPKLDLLINLHPQRKEAVMALYAGDNLINLKIGDLKGCKIYEGDDLIWAGASEVSYYDGNTLLGTEEVDEGDDVLHPSFSTSKLGYTLYGWTQTSGSTTRVTSLTATGEPMTLYAIYTPNTVTAVSNGTITDAEYVSGNVSATAIGNYNQSTASASFNLSKGRYQTATCTVYAEFDNHNTANLDLGDVTFNGVNVLGYDTDGWISWDQGNTSGSQVYNINEGTHTLFVRAIAYNDYSQRGDISVSSLVLSNPIEWT